MNAVDTEIAAAWPDRWAKADSARPGASKRRNNLRKAWAQHTKFSAFKATNPTAACSNCRHYELLPVDAQKRHHCSIGSDFHGYLLTQPDHVCTSWEGQRS